MLLFSSTKGLKAYKKNFISQLQKMLGLDSIFTTSKTSNKTNACRLTRSCLKSDFLSNFRQGFKT